MQFEGSSADEVKEHYDNQRTIFSFNVMNVGKKKLIKIDPFNQTCIGVETAHRYTVHLNMVRIDLSKIILLVTGLLLFFYAKTLSQTPLFYYLTGIFLGIFASFMVLVYFSSKIIPRVSDSFSELVNVVKSDEYESFMKLSFSLHSTETGHVWHINWRMDGWFILSSNDH